MLRYVDNSSNNASRIQNNQRTTNSLQRPIAKFTEQSSSIIQTEQSICHVLPFNIPSSPTRHDEKQEKETGSR
jgi:hypothetical protein